MSEKTHRRYVERVNQLVARRVALIARDGPCCYICENEAAETIDHVVPLSQGGSHDISNLRLCCRNCNKYKANVESYMASWEFKDPSRLPSEKQIGRIRSSWQYFTKVRKKNETRNEL